MIWKKTKGGLEPRLNIRANYKHCKTDVKPETVDFRRLGNLEPDLNYIL